MLLQRHQNSVLYKLFELYKENDCPSNQFDLLEQVFIDPFINVNCFETKFLYKPV